MEPIECVFRHPGQGEDESETAHCLLLSQILGTTPDQCPVTRSMCKVCLKQTRDATFRDHPIFPSLVYHFSSEQLSSATSPVEQAHWETWHTRAETAILNQSKPSPGPPPVPCCDVILCVHQESPLMRAVIESILDQCDAIPILHLIETGTDAVDWSAYSSRWNVQIHRLSGPQTALSAATLIASSLRTPYLAIQCPDTISGPTRLAVSVLALRETGAELFVAHAPPEEPDECSNDRTDLDEMTLIPTSLVLRRATFVDISGPEPGQFDSETQLIARAYEEGRQVATRPESVEARPTLRVNTNTTPPSPLVRNAQRRCRFPIVPVRCDVVLPFRGQLHFVREALASLLAQELATPIIHLIDDATEEDTTDFLHEWSQHPQLRVYRNRENIGQFQSFNNVAPFWETDLVAVQDADDISLPHRLQCAGQMLHWSGADYFGGAVELFGDDELIRPTMQESTNLIRMRRTAYRRSFYPKWSKTDYFLENPTAVFRTAMFREMGGYADFGSRLMNRTSLDTEFQLRCLFRGVRFAITRDVVTRYRVHPESATQDRLTGWGTTPRSESIRQLEDRCRLFRRGDFDPRSFGALGRYSGITTRWLCPE